MAGAFADSKGRYGYRRIKAVLKTGVSEKVVRRIMACVLASWRPLCERCFSAV
ncbi:transposase [Bifidobacterium longum]|uniref:transposase n=1 Tax=Bifidobacterium longum TaxID=216816 RepID=UPI001E413354|nr:transposase [Bifidobacterium longum]